MRKTILSLALALTLAACGANAPADIVTLSADAVPCALAVQAAEVAAVGDEAKALAAAGVAATNSACIGLSTTALQAVNSAVAAAPAK